VFPFKTLIFFLHFSIRNFKKGIMDHTAETPTRDQLLDILKRSGPRSVRDLADQLEISEMAVRQHLAGLQGADLVRPEKMPRPVGRPAMLWHLTEAAQSRYPDAHSDLTVELIGDMRALFGEKGMEKLLARRAGRQVAQYHAAMRGARGLRGKLRALARIRSREGYMADVADGPDGSLLFVENHCPVCAAARACAGLCRMELEVFREALGPGVEIERCEHILEGARRCAYRVEKVESNSKLPSSEPRRSPPSRGQARNPGTSRQD
jgi:predicted ArsR family transcriptional regulator